MSFTKYIKNTSSVVKIYVGNSIPVGAYYLIQPQEDNSFSTDTGILADLATGDATMAYDNSGSNNISDLNEAIDFLKNNITEVVISGVDIVGGGIKTTAVVSVQTEAPTYSSKSRIELSAPSQNLPRNNQAYYTAFSYSGAGLLANFIMDFNSEQVQISCEVDGDTLFELDVKTLKDMYDDVTVYNTWLVYDKKKKTVTFSPEFPIKYTTNVTIKARASSDNNGRKLERIMVDLTKES